jgi:hypothetical protein
MSVSGSSIGEVRLASVYHGRPHIHILFVNSAFVVLDWMRTGGHERLCAVSTLLCAASGYPEGFGLARADGSVRSGSHGMPYHPDANNADRFTREPYGPPDYVSAFFYLTDVNESTPVSHTAKSIGRKVDDSHCVFC